MTDCLSSCPLNQLELPRRVSLAEETLARHDERLERLHQNQKMLTEVLRKVEESVHHIDKEMHSIRQDSSDTKVIMLKVKDEITQFCSVESIHYREFIKHNAQHTETLERLNRNVIRLATAAVIAIVTLSVLINKFNLLSIITG